MNMPELILEAEKFKGQDKGFIVHVEGHDGNATSFSAGDPLAIICGTMQSLVKTAHNSGMPLFMLHSILSDAIREAEEDAE